MNDEIMKIDSVSKEMLIMHHAEWLLGHYNWPREIISDLDALRLIHQIMEKHTYSKDAPEITWHDYSVLKDATFYLFPSMSLSLMREDYSDVAHELHKIIREVLISDITPAIWYNILEVLSLIKEQEEHNEIRKNERVDKGYGNEKSKGKGS